MHRQFRLLNFLLVKQILLLSAVLRRKVDGRTPSGQQSPFPTISGPIQVMGRNVQINENECYFKSGIEVQLLQREQQSVRIAKVHS